VEAARNTSNATGNKQTGRLMMSQRMNSHFPILIVIAFSLGLIVRNSLVAQIFDDRITRPTIPTDLRQGGSAYYNFTMEGGISVEVNLWGYVRNPGLYRIPSSTDVLGLLSYGGGPLENATLSEVKLIRREVKTDSTYTDRILVIDVERVTETGSRKGIPTLLPGDVVLVPGSAYSQWANVLSIFTQIVLVVSGIFSIIRLAENK
jgi:hypothetical protein